MAKYIDAEKLTKAIEEKGLDCSFALKMERLDTLALIDSLQQKQPEQDITEFEKALSDFGDAYATLVDRDNNPNIGIHYDAYHELVQERVNEILSLAKEYVKREQLKSRIMTREMIEGRLLQNDTESWNEDYNEEDLQTRFAFYTYKDDPSTLYLSNVFVEEASRNHGFGTRILRAAEKVAETIGATTISLKVKQDSPANVWYRKNGYGYVAFEDEYDWLEKNLEYLKQSKFTEWSEEDKKIVETICKEGDLKPSEKRWLKSLSERFNLQPKQERAEKDLALTLEDIVRLDCLIMGMEAEGYNEGYKTRPFYEEVLRRFYEAKK